MKPFNITIRGESYSIEVGTNFAPGILEAIKAADPSRIAIITDSEVRRHWGKEVLTAAQICGKPVEIFSFPHGEKNKNQKTVTTLQHAMLKKRYGRDTLIVALGGGVVGDVAGFVAATYLRGVPYIHVPTTILAMVDSSIGGKVGIDTPYGKNTIGAFYQPRAVIADLRFIGTQKKDHVVNGLLEAIKTFFTSDKSGLALVEKLDLKNPTKNPAVLKEVIDRSLRIKGGIVMRDETEQGERKIINFGHTIGHAIELLSKFRIPHGYCVGYGMLVEARIAELSGVLKSADREYLELYLAKFGINSKPIRKFSISKILQATRADKKSKGGVPHYVLLSNIGSVMVKDGVYAFPIDDAVVSKALRLCTGNK